jgi:hypothetical protein
MLLPLAFCPDFLPLLLTCEEERKEIGMAGR